MRPNRASRRLAAALLAVAGLVLSSCSRNAAPRNLLLLTLDTTRFDRLSCYGSRTVATPALDSIAQRGVRFAQAFTTAPLTLVAHTSLMTGLYPLEHQVHDNSRFRLVDSYDTLAEVLQRSGFDTAAFVSASVLRKSVGIAQGFDHYDDQSTLVAAASREAQRIGGETTEAAISWLRGRPDSDKVKPLFLWVHYFDPHQPYQAPGRVEGPGPEDYDAEVAYMDTCVRTLLTEFDRLGLADSTVTVAIADHGEALGEHGEPNHGVFLYEETTRIPFVMSAPGLLPEGKVVDDGIASSVDLMPTVLELLGVKATHAMQGRSLVAAARGEGPAGTEAVMESFYGAFNLGWSPLRALRTPTHKAIRAPKPELYDEVRDPDESTNLAESDKAGLESRLDRLTRLESDLAHRAGEGESPNDGAFDKAQASDLAKIGYISAPRVLPVDVQSNKLWKGRDAKDRIKSFPLLARASDLKNLGKPAAAASLYQQVLAEEPDNVVLLTLFAQASVDANRLDDAAAALEKADDLDPDNPEILIARGQLELKRAKFAKPGDEASRQEHARQSALLLARGIDLFEKTDAAHNSGCLNEPRIDLGAALLMLGKKEEAERQFAEVRRRSGEDIYYLQLIAIAHAESGDRDGAAALFESLTRKQPEADSHWMNLSRVYSSQGKTDRAKAAAEEGLRHCPNSAGLRGVLDKLK